MSEVKPVENICKNLQSFLDISPVQDYKTEQYQIKTAILEGICCPDNPDQKLINCLSRRSLTAVHTGCLSILHSIGKAQELF